MKDHGIELPYFRRHVVPAVVALASESRQREVWLNSAEFESLDHVVHVLFDDFCDALDPGAWLGKSLRTEEEVTLMARLGVAYSAVQERVGAEAADGVYLAAAGWPYVVSAAARLAQVMVGNDLDALAHLHDNGHRWPPRPGSGEPGSE